MNCSFLSLRHDDPSESIDEIVTPVNPNLILTNRNKTEATPDPVNLLAHWFSGYAGLILIGGAVSIYWLFVNHEPRNDIARQLRFQDQSEQEQNSEQDHLVEDTSEMEGRLRQRFASMPLPTLTHSAVFPLAGMNSDDWVEVMDDGHVELADKEVQTEDRNFSPSSASSETLCLKEEVTRSVEECLAVYRSEVSFFLILTLFYTINKLRCKFSKF